VILALIKAYVLRLASLEAVLRASHKLKTIHKSTLSYALRRRSVCKVAHTMVEALDEWCRADCSSIIVVDSMALTLPRTQRTNAKKMNNNTVGGGVLWQFCVNAPKHSNPAHILKFMSGPWNDTCQIRDCKLVPNGPIYVMDQGFYSRATLGLWLDQHVRFVVRAKAFQCHYRAVKRCGNPRGKKAMRIIWDGVAIIGNAPHGEVRVRLVWCKKNGKDLVVCSSLFDATAEDLLLIYKKRWAIERFHKVIKHVIGLGHLYSLQGSGLELLVCVSFVLAALVYLTSGSPKPPGDLINLLNDTLRKIRRILTITEWKPNICTHRWAKKRKPNH
jgi:hypothetical protein